MRTTEELLQGIEDARYLKELLVAGLRSAEASNDAAAVLSFQKAAGGFNHMVAGLQEVLHVVAHIDPEVFDAATQAAEACEAEGKKTGIH